MTGYPEDPFVCERCGDPLGSGFRFCSVTCMHEWRREQGDPPIQMTFEEMQAEMEVVFERLRARGEEDS
jgi:hypothetical protein